MKRVISIVVVTTFLITNPASATCYSNCTNTYNNGKNTCNAQYAADVAGTNPILQAQIVACLSTIITLSPAALAACAGLTGSYLSRAYSVWAQRDICMNVVESNYDGCTGWCDIQINRCESESWNPTCQSPIVISLSGKTDFTDAASGVYFDLDGNGSSEHTAWTDASSDNAFLVLDRNRDGAIESGAELFGDATAQPVSSEPNGFEALAMFDDPKYGGDGNGRISNGDNVFAALQLWSDVNHDGVSQANELQPLAGVVSWIGLDYKTKENKTDQYGNQLRWRAPVGFTGKTVNKGATDVIFTVQP
jgi:hypothetical protein